MIITLPLKGAWLTLPDGESLQLTRDSSWGSDTRSQDGEVRQYAARRRVITAARRTGQAQLTFTDVTVDQLDWLYGHIGRVMLLRDSHWRRWGTYLSINPSTILQYDMGDAQLYRVTVPWQDTDFNEAV